MLGPEIFHGIKFFEWYETLGKIYFSKCNKTSWRNSEIYIYLSVGLGGGLSHVIYYGIFMAIKALLDMQISFYTDTDHERNYTRWLEYSISLHVSDFKNGDGKKRYVCNLRLQT